MGREADLAPGTGREGGTEGFCPWPESCGAARWDLCIRSERVGEGWKLFSGEGSVALWLVGNEEGNREEADAEGYV